LLTAPSSAQSGAKTPPGTAAGALLRLAHNASSPLAHSAVLGAIRRQDAAEDGGYSVINLWREYPEEMHLNRHCLIA
jgi:hypothetical protein